MDILKRVSKHKVATAAGLSFVAGFLVGARSCGTLSSELSTPSTESVPSASAAPFTPSTTESYIQATPNAACSFVVSDYLDAQNQRQLRATITGPVLGKKIVGSTFYWGDDEQTDVSGTTADHHYVKDGDLKLWGGVTLDQRILGQWVQCVPTLISVSNDGNALAYADLAPVTPTSATPTS